jgi:hypothetical protein
MTSPHAKGADGAAVPPELLQGLVKLVRATVSEEVRAAVHGEADPWIPHTAWPCASRRAAVALANSRAMPGVRKLGKVFVVRRSELDAYIEAQRPDREPDAPADEFEQAMARYDLHKGAARVRRAA